MANDYAQGIYEIIKQGLSPFLIDKKVATFQDGHKVTTVYLFGIVPIIRRVQFNS